MVLHTDIAIIGAGPGGYVAALRATQLGAKVVCIEKQWVGGVCLNDGCIPTKALLRSAEVLALARETETFGITVGEPTVDWPAVQARREHVVQQLVGGVTMLLQRAGVQMLSGSASFIRPNTLAVQMEDGVETVVADNVIIATGSRTLQVPIPGIDGPGVIDHRAALRLSALPESICIIGSGAIGLEFASMLNAFGVETTLVEMLPRLAPLMDASIGEGLEWAFTQAGISVCTSARVTRIDSDESGCVVSLEEDDGSSQIEAQLVLSAIGRTPNVEGLGLDVLGIKPGRAGIQVDDRMRTAVPHVYAIGDVAAAGPMLAHVASHQGIVAVEDAMGHSASMDYTAVPGCIFSMPEAAGVGLTEEQAREQDYDVQVGTFALANNGKAIAMGDTNGFCKIVSESTHGAVLGVHIVGPHASDLILEGTLAMSLEATLDELERTIHPHPALGEAIAEAALAARKRAIHLPRSSS